MNRREFWSTAATVLGASALGVPGHVRAAPAAGRQGLPRTRSQGGGGRRQQIEVVEFFWYSCPHCNAFEPKLNAWLRTMPADVSFRRVPVAFRRLRAPAAPVLYAGSHGQARRDAQQGVPGDPRQQASPVNPGRVHPGLRRKERPGPRPLRGALQLRRRLRQGPPRGAALQDMYPGGRRARHGRGRPRTASTPPWPAPWIAACRSSTTSSAKCAGRKSDPRQAARILRAAHPVKAALPRAFRPLVNPATFRAFMKITTARRSLSPPWPWQAVPGRRRKGGPHQAHERRADTCAMTTCSRPSVFTGKVGGDQGLHRDPRRP